MTCITHNIHSLTFADGLGYHDDGEEHLGVGEDAYDGAQRFYSFVRMRIAHLIPPCLPFFYSCSKEEIEGIST